MIWRESWCRKKIGNDYSGLLSSLASAGLAVRKGLTKLGTKSSFSARVRMVFSSFFMMILRLVTSTISLRGMVSSESRKDLISGRVTMSCSMVKLSLVTVESVTRPSFVPFLVSTLRFVREKFNWITLSI